jgi:formamidopyrimidine-DNA glycosylase
LPEKFHSCRYSSTWREPSVPELPDVTVYVERLQAFVVGHRLERLRIGAPFVLKTVDALPQDYSGHTLAEVSRLGKRIVFTFDRDLFVVIHLMIAGRLHWKAAGAAIPKRGGLSAFDFDNGTLLLTEAGTKHRASVYLLVGPGALVPFMRNGVSVFASSPVDFIAALRRENRTLKRALTDPGIVDGIGNSYSDEILHRAKLSPFEKTAQMSDDDGIRLYKAAREVLTEWTERLRDEVGAGFPEKVTAFHPEMAVHGRYGKPCPACGTPIQRVVYAENEANYCPKCQTGGRLLADRSLSRLLKADWPRTIEELERLNPQRPR